MKDKIEEIVWKQCSSDKTEQLGGKTTKITKAGKNYGSITQRTQLPKTPKYVTLYYVLGPSQSIQAACL